MGMLKVEIKSNAKAVQKELEARTAMILEVIGLKAEGYAKENIRDRMQENNTYRNWKTTGVLANSITHTVSEDGVLSVGSGAHYSPYVELGTGTGFKPPPEWETSNAPKGKPRVDRGWYWKDLDGKWHYTTGMKGRHFLRDAIEDHMDEYKAIAERLLKNEQ